MPFHPHPLSLLVFIHGTYKSTHLAELSYANVATSKNKDLSVHASMEIRYTISTDNTKLIL